MTGKDRAPVPPYSHISGTTREWSELHRLRNLDTYSMKERASLLLLFRPPFNCASLHSTQAKSNRPRTQSRAMIAQEVHGLSYRMYSTPREWRRGSREWRACARLAWDCMEKLDSCVFSWLARLLRSAGPERATIVLIRPSIFGNKPWVARSDPSTPSLLYYSLSICSRGRQAGTKEQLDHCHGQTNANAELGSASQSLVPPKPHSSQNPKPSVHSGAWCPLALCKLGHCFLSRCVWNIDRT